MVQAVRDLVSGDQFFLVEEALEVTDLQQAERNKHCHAQY
jgi:hypothetical protein